MIPFKGRSSLKQYMTLKPIKRGIKVYMRADAYNGYVSACKAYTGKGLGAKVVKGLAEQLHGTYRHVFWDNVFSSVDLALDLLRAGVYSCETLRSNGEGFPTLLKPVVKKGFGTRGNSKTYRHRNLTVSVYGKIIESNQIVIH